MRTQKQEVLAHLREGPLTPLQALDMYRVMRLAPRIQELRDDGYQIATELKVQRDKRTGRIKRYAEYHLEAS